MDLVGLVLVIDAVHALLATGDQLPHGVHGIVGLTLNHAEIKFKKRVNYATNKSFKTVLMQSDLTKMSQQP